VVLTALVAAARRHDLGGAAYAAEFSTHFSALFKRLLTHLSFLVGVLSAGSADPTVIESVQLLAVPSLLSDVLPFCTPEQESELVVALQQIAGQPSAQALV
jgi:hypothetical protein